MSSPGGATSRRSVTVAVATSSATPVRAPGISRVARRRLKASGKEAERCGEGQGVGAWRMCEIAGAGSRSELWGCDWQADGAGGELADEGDAQWGAEPKAGDRAR